MAVERNAGKGAESTNAAFIQGQKNGNNKSSGGQKEHKDSSHIWKKKTKKHLDDLQDWENILWTDKTRQEEERFGRFKSCYMWCKCMYQTRW